MKKIIALDIDGTLTNSKKEITKPTLDKIMEIQKKDMLWQLHPDGRCLESGRLRMNWN